MPIGFYIADDLFASHFPEISYVIKFFLYRAGIEENASIHPLSSFSSHNAEAINVVYAPLLPDKVKDNFCFIWCQRDFWQSYFAPQDRAEICSFNDCAFPLIFKNSEAAVPILSSDKTLFINFDLFAAIFFVLARVEEYGNFTPDEHQRFPVTESWLYRSALLEQPVVDRWVLLFASSLQHFWHIPFNMALFSDNKTIINLNFDVDLVRYYNLRRLIAAPLIGLVREKKLSAAIQFLLQAIKYLLKKSPDPYWGFPLIKNIQEEVFHSQRRSQKLEVGFTFFIIPQKKTEWEEYDLFNDARLQGRLVEVITAKEELALQCSYGCVDSTEELIKEKEKLEGVFQRSVSGLRHHYLRFKVPLSWTSAAEAGLKYDATFGFAEHEGFRAGTAFPFLPFDVKRRVDVPIIEIPLIIMDVSLQYHRRISAAKAKQIFSHLLEKCQQVKGVLTILWHSSNLQGFGWDAYVNSLVDFLRQLSGNQNISFLTCQQISQQAFRRFQQCDKKYVN